MTVIGLTGGIASGKSTAAEYLRSLGATLIDADRVGHRSYEPGTPGFEKVVNAFGHDIVGKDGLVDRRILGGKVFGAPGEMERLNFILWPEIRRLISEELRELKRRDRHQIIVLEAAVLIEAGWMDLCDEIWVVTATLPIAVARLMARNSFSQETALARINAQMSSRDRAEYGDVKIDNSGTEAELRQRLDRAWKALTKRVGGDRAVKSAAKASARPPAKGVASRAAAPKAPARRAPAAKSVARKATPVKATPARASAARSATPRQAPAKAAPAPAASRSAARPAPARPAPARPAPAQKAAARTAPPRASARPAAKAAPAKPGSAKAAPSRPTAKAAPSRATSRTTSKVPSRTAVRAAAKPARKAPAKAPARASTKTPARASTKTLARASTKTPARASAKTAGKVAARTRRR